MTPLKSPAGRKAPVVRAAERGAEVAGLTKGAKSGLGGVSRDGRARFIEMNRQQVIGVGDRYRLARHTDIAAACPIGEGGAHQGPSAARAAASISAQAGPST